MNEVEMIENSPQYLEIVEPSNIQSIPPEILGHIFSFCDPSDLLSVSFTCKLFHSFEMDIDFNTRIRCAMAWRGFVFDLIPSYLNGQIDHRAIQTYIEIMMNTRDINIQKDLMKFFSISSGKIMKNTIKWNDVELVTILLEVYLFSGRFYETDDPTKKYEIVALGFEYRIKNMILELSLNMVKKDISRLIPHCQSIYERWKNESSKENREMIHGVLYQFIASIPINDTPLHPLVTDNLWKEIQKILTKNECSIIHMYHLCQQSCCDLEEYRELFPNHFDSIFYSAMWPGILKRDAVEELKTIYRYQANEMHFQDAYHAGANECLKFLLGTFSDKDRALRSAILNIGDSQKEGWSAIKQYMKQFKGALSPCDPLDFAIKYRRWAETVKIARMGHDMSTIAGLIKKVLERYLNAVSDETHPDEVEKFIKRCLRSVHYKNDHFQHSFLRDFFRICVRRTGTLLPKIFQLAKKKFRHPAAYQRYMIVAWAFSGENHSLVFDPHILKLILSIEDSDVKDKTILYAIEYLLGKPPTYHRPDDLQEIAKIPVDARKKYFGILFPHLSLSVQVEALKMVYKEWDDLQLRSLSHMRI